MSFSLGKADRFEVPPKPETWIQNYDHSVSNASVPCVRADPTKIPPFLQVIVTEVFSKINTVHPSFIEFKNKERFVAEGEKLPDFGGKLSEEQHILYMIPFVMETPPLLALLLTLDKASTQPHISKHYTITDVHAFYREVFEYLQMMASFTDANPIFAARVAEALKGYTTHCISAKAEFEKEVAQIPGSKALASKAPSGNAPLPDLSPYYSTESVGRFAKLAFCYNRSLVAAIELALCCSVDLSAKMCAAAGLIQVDVHLKPSCSLIHSTVVRTVRDQEAKITSECIDYPKGFVAPMPPPQSLSEWIVSPEFLFVNWCLVSMKLNR